jgi:SM-20-related protein
MSVAASTLRTVVDALATEGWAACPGFLGAADVAELAALVDAKSARGELRSAAVGAGAARAVRTDVRGDEIEWLVAPGSAAERRALESLEDLRVALNRDLQLGLDELEVHYARYAPGTRYARHLDRSPAGSERVVSVIQYLNPDWRTGDGGELAIHADDGEVVVEPRGGTLVAFLSERFEHEVRTAQAARRSLTGWFRRRPLGLRL